jgi:hypothetical protein
VFDISARLLVLFLNLKMDNLNGELPAAIS